MSGQTPTDVVDYATALETALETAAFTEANAVGLSIDDPDDPHVAVAVRHGRIVYIGISDPMLRVGLDQLQDVLNATIVNAFAMWQAQRMRWEPA